MRSIVRQVTRLIGRILELENQCPIENDNTLDRNSGLSTEVAEGRDKRSAKNEAKTYRPQHACSASWGLF
jgi:hypothetical protein